MDKRKSLRYLLDKDRFKGRKLPPKLQTNEDLIDPDQRGDHASGDKDLIEIDRLKANFKKPIEDMEFSRRGLFGGLTKLKEYAEESDAKARELKKKQRRIKINLKEEEEESEEGVETKAELSPRHGSRRTGRSNSRRDRATRKTETKYLPPVLRVFLSEIP